MWKTFLLTALTISSTAATAAVGDDLFFKESFRETYEYDSAAPTPGQARRRAPEPKPRPLSGINGLQTTLLAAGYTARIGQNETILVDISRDDWFATVTMNITNGGRTLKMAIPLTTPEANTVIAPKTLRALLEANANNKAAFFAVVGDPQRIELQRTLSNDGLDSDELRTTIDAMAAMAVKTRDVWNADGVRVAPKTSTPAKEQPATPAPATTAEKTPAATPQTPASSTTSLNGKWVATPNTNEAFALQLDANGTFRLVHVKGTKSTKSKGTFTLASTSLSLRGDDGTNLTGTITRQTDGFVLTLGSGTKSITLTFKGAK